jgi:predicted RNA-binding Zn-ribbon protein involved in translation (DUF1610 family)
MTSISDLKNIADVLQKAGKTEELQKIYELQQQQLDMQSEIQELKKEKETLEAKLNEKEEMHFDKAKGVYVKNDEEDEYFCPACWDGKKKQIRLQNRCKQGEFYDCKVCNNNFQVAQHLRPVTFE